VRAGLEILTALRTLNDALEPKHGIRLAVRVGIHTGPVVIGEMGGGAKSEVLALGDTTNIAARLEAVAAPGTVVISGATQRLVPGMFLLQDLGTPPLKGIATPIRAYAVLQATGVRSRLDVDPNKLTPLVGRDQEVGLLIERWEQTQESDGQVVLIAGEAGLGKSRLLQAFRERLADTPHTWLECHCTPYTEGSAFYPLIELVEQGLGFKPSNKDSTATTPNSTGCGPRFSSTWTAMRSTRRRRSSTSPWRSPGGKRQRRSSCAPPPAWRGSGSARASATPPAIYWPRCMRGSPKASTRGI
jgi:hypothetical protein